MAASQIKFSNQIEISVLMSLIEVVAQRCSVKKVLLEISQNSQENTCAKVSFLIKLQALGKRLCTGVFLWILQNF